MIVSIIVEVVGDATGQFAQLPLEQGRVFNGELEFFHLVFEFPVDPGQFGRAFFDVRFQLFPTSKLCSRTCLSYSSQCSSDLCFCLPHYRQAVVVEKEAQHERLYQLAERLGRIVTEKDEQLAAAAARAEEQDRRISELETQLARLRGTVRE